MWVVANENWAAVKMLLKNEITVNTKEYSGWNTLMKSVFAENTEIVKTIIENGANLHSKNIGGLMALSIAEELHLRQEISRFQYLTLKSGHIVAA